MAERARRSARTLLASLLAPALLALLVPPARGRGGRNHGDWDADALLPPLPPREDAARVARFVTHVCSWGALATVSTLEAVRGRPFADVLSLSDGPPGAGSGVPYFYLSPLQLSVSNLQENPYATLTMSLAQTDFCRKHGFDPQSPLCAHTILSGTVTKVKRNTVNLTTRVKFLGMAHTNLKGLTFLWKVSQNISQFSVTCWFAYLLACLWNRVGLLLDFLEDVFARFFPPYFEAIFIEECLSLKSKFCSINSKYFPSGAP
ncbi:protein CREG1 isoform X1 [Cynocephalus volans]|uniref:protein CREG1 isoform X1 n=1 Tax=Cynocephalus volans TaxID=110931 RepID=UPI002FCC534C